MKKYLAKNYTNIVAYFIALLFVYAAISKVIDFENFQVQLAQSPLLSAYSGFISYAVIIVELLLAMFLCLPNYQQLALYGALGLMSAFTIYIFLILNYSDFVPCSCGGILEKLGWTEHLIFNIVVVLLAFVAILYKEKKVNPKKKLALPLLFSFVTLIVSCGIVIVLFLSSEHIIKKENNFTRRFLPHPIVERGKLDLKVNSYYFAGIDQKNLYLGNYSSPLTFSVTDTTLSTFKQVKIHLDKSEYTFKNLQLKVKAPFFYLYDGSVPVIYRGRLGDSTAREISYKNAYFTQLAVIDSVKFALRTQNSRNRQYVIASLNLLEEPKVTIHQDILEKQQDGVFDVDGKLISSTGTNEFIYCYSYRNQFIIMDDSLNVLRRLNTIDTIKTAQIATTKLSDGKHKMNAPPLQVNDLGTSYKKVFFNKSNLMGKHESRKSWENSAVIDMYNIDKQEYFGSFYIDSKKKAEITSLLSYDKFFFMISGKTLVKYQFRNTITRYYK
jgi:uncharacterized membrane protein YphA (DoxX/SURF4 family)